MDKNQNPPPLPTLPLHLMLSMGTWLASPFALASASAGLPPSKPQKNLQKAVAKEAQNRANEMLAGISRYLETPYQRNIKEPPAIWTRGSARLLDYGMDTLGASEASAIALFVPSLINKYYVLDLEQERSLLRWLPTQGIYPLVLDWGTPGKKEETHDVETYITDILLPAIDFIYKAAGQKVTLAGYCMGGVLSLAAAQLRPKQISSLALLATPWDFHCREFSPFVLEKPMQDYMRSLIAKNNFVPAEIIQSLFYLTDPWVFQHKFRRFVGMNPDSRSARDFVALEHWVNDGVAMTAGVARDCLLGWAQQNWLANGMWRVGDKKIDPRKLKIPTFIAIPKNDHVVPYDCAFPLTAMFKNPYMINPSAGHVGMIVGGKAKRELWQPFADWLVALQHR